VRVHGHVSEERKRELYQRAWVNLTASSAEGWCLTVMEAAACGTPSAALAVGGLPESIEDGRTGVLARDPDDLAQKTRALLSDRDWREAMGRAALERAHEFTWDATARRTLNVLEGERERAAGRPALLRSLADTDTGRAAGLAAALMVNNFLALVVTIAFARMLGASGYGSLGALLAAFAILMVPGSALQATVAREVSSEAADGSADPARGVRSWLRHLLLATVAATGASLLLRDAVAAAVGVEEEYGWAAAAVVPTAFLWLVLCVQRGALQGLRRYRVVGQSIVGEAAGRLLLGVALVGAGLGVTGAFIASTLGIAIVCLALVPALGRALGPARAGGGAEPPFSYLLSRAWAPVLAFSLIAALQNIDIVIVKHAADDDAAGSYAAASVAAKAVIWVAIGLGLYLLPEAVRRTRAGQDARPVLARTIALIGAIALPTIAIYALAAEPILSAVFGPDLTEASGALPLLAIAMALLACGYLAVQYLLALGRVSFVVILGLAAALELVLLATVGAQLTQVALVVAALQLGLAALLGLAVRSARRQALAPA
jgi:O-antigen/teichoic acid export membrane protein